jgi:RNA recognition motif-containing protein
MLFMHIHITNLHGDIIEADLQRLFCLYGEVSSVVLMRDRLNYRSLRHGFIEMPVSQQGQQAVVSLDGTLQKGNRISVAAVLYDPIRDSSSRGNGPDQYSDGFLR